MSPHGKLLFELWPYLAAFIVGALVPRRQGWPERVALGVIGVLAVTLVSGLWPGAEVVPENPHEWPQLLNLIVFLPIAGAVAILFLPRQAPDLLRRFTMVVLLLDLLASLWLLSVPMTMGWHFQYIHEWLPSFGIRYHVAVDGISMWLILLTTLTTPIAAYVSFGSIRRRTKDLAFSLLLLHGAMLGAFVSLDLFLFYLFWELMLVPMLILIGVWGGVDKIKAAYKFFIYTMAGSMLMLAAILYLVFQHQKLAGYMSFDYLALGRVMLPQTAAKLCFAAFALAFVIKVPMFPLHTWLPDAHVQAPTGGSIILAAVLLKLGTYGYMRFCMGLFAGAAWWAGANLAGLAVGGGILYAALVAWKQDDIKRLVAYSSVAHLGFCMLGLFAATRAGVEGAILQMVNHGISTGALFLLVGVLYDRRHTREVREFGGIAKVMPVYAALFVVVTLASIGVPGTNGFVGEFMVLTGTFVSAALGVMGPLQAVFASLGVILAAVYMLSVVQRTFFGPLTNPKNKKLADINVRETVAVAPLIVLVFVIGFFPSLFLDRMSASVDALLDHYRNGRMQYLDMADAKEARLAPRRGGPLERGYPKSPSEQKEAAAQTAAAPPPTPGDCRGGQRTMTPLFGLSPYLVVGLGALLLMLAEAFGRGTPVAGVVTDPTDAGSGRSAELALGAAIVLFAGAVLSIAVWLVGPEKLEGLDGVAPYLLIDRFSIFFCFVLCLGGALAALLAGGYMPEHNIDRGEFFPLLLLSTLGAMALASAGDLLSLFIGLETMSLGVYCMIGLRRGSSRAAEASVKYFLLGSFAAALTLFGAALLYGATGHTDLAGIGKAVATIGAPGSHVGAPTVVVALVLVLSGLGFKVSAVPFHMWTPDAYEGAPTPTTTYMAVAVKSAAFAVLLRVLLVAFGDPRLTSWSSGWPPVIATLAVLSMTVANLVAGRQESVKRMLAYSSIAHAGYALVGVTVTMKSTEGQSAVLFYLLAYTVSTVGAFGALILCGRRGAEAVSYEDLAGIGRRHPAAALAFSLFLLSLAGIPPLAGFFGKLYIFRAAIDSGFYWLAIIGLLNSVLGAYYYLRVMVFMYFREPAPGAPLAVPMKSGYVASALLIAAVLVLALGLVPGMSLDMVVAAVART